MTLGQLGQLGVDVEYSFGAQTPGCVGVRRICCAPIATLVDVPVAT